MTYALGLLFIGPSVQEDDPWFPDWISESGYVRSYTHDLTDRSRSCSLAYERQDGLRVQASLDGRRRERPEDALRVVSNARFDPPRGVPSGHPLAKLSYTFWANPSNRGSYNLNAYSFFGSVQVAVSYRAVREGRVLVLTPVADADIEAMPEEVARWCLAHYETRTWSVTLADQTKNGRPVAALRHSGTGAVYLRLRDYVGAIDGDLSVGANGTRAQVVKGGRTSIVCAGALEAKVGGSMVDAGGAVLMKGGEIYVSSSLAGRL